MDQQNRIQNLSAVQTVSRQTPKKDFGDELASVGAAGARIGLGIVGSAVGANPVVNAAVSTVTGAVSAVTGVTSQNVGSSQSASTAAMNGIVAVGGGRGQIAHTSAQRLEAGGASDSLAKQAQMNQESQAFSAMYLNLQSEMQQESRQFNAISNIIKVRHDSAKAAINNIR
jgi:hypothetical protein